MPRLIPLLFLALVLTGGCTSRTTHSTEVAPAPDPALEELSQAAAKIHADLAQLAAMQAGNEAEYQMAEPVSGDLSRPVSLRWSGPIEPVLKILADILGYSVRVVGNPPVNPPLVNLDAHMRPAFEVLEDLGWQAGRRVGIEVHEAERQIQLVYVGADS